MHIAYIHQHFATRKAATGTRSYEMSRGLLAAGHRVSMVCGVYDATRAVLNPQDRISRLEIEGIDVHCVAEPYSNQMGFSRRLLAFWRFMRTAEKIVRQIKPDLVFATSTPLTVGIPGMKSARKLGVPFVFEVRDLWPEIPIAMGILRNPLLIWYTRRLERRIYSAAERIVALSPGMKEGICSTGYPADRIELIPNGCDLDLFQPSAEPLTDVRFGAPDECRFVFCGAHGMANGLDAVLDGAAELKRRGESGIRFVFIGQGSERERLIRRSETEGTAGMISWVPFIPKDELSQLLPRMDVGMMILSNIRAFYYGTSPNKFFDYIASGIPVLNNYPGWVAGMIEENECGRVVAPDDPGAFADACVWFRDHREELPRMGARGRALAERDFARDRLAARFVANLERVAGAAGIV